MANKVWVAVVPDTKGFARDLKGYLDRLETSLRVVVPVVADVDDRLARRDLSKLTESRSSTVNVDADTGLASAQIAVAARRRTVELKAEVQKRSLAAVGTALAALSGGRVAQSALSGIGTALSNLDKSVPAIAGLALSVGSIGSVALSSVGGIVTMGAALAPLAALAAPLPGLLLAGGAAVGVFAAVMADAGTQLGSLKPAFAGLQDQLSSAFWAKAKQPILDLVNGVFPSLKSGLTDVASSLGSWSASVAGSFQKAFPADVITGILGPLSQSIKNSTSGTDAFASSIAALGVFGAQYLPAIGTAFSNLSVSFNDWIQGVVGNGQLAGWVSGGVSVLKQLGDVAGSVFGILGGVASAATAAGSNGLQTLAGALGTINGIVNGPAFQGALTTVFTGAAQGAENLGRALAPIGGLFQSLAPVISSALSGLSLVAGELVGGIASALSQPLVAAGLQTAIAGIMEGVEGLLPALPPLATAFGSLLGIVGSLAAVIGPVLGQALAVLAPVITTLATGLQPVIAMLGPALTEAITMVVPLISELTTALVPLMSAVLPLLASALNIVLPALQALMPALVALVPPIVQVATLVAEILTAAFQELAPKVQIAVTAIVPIIQALASIITGVVTTVTGLLSGNWAQAWKGAQQIVQGISSAISATISGLINIITGRVTGGLDIVRSAFNSVFTALGNVVLGAMSAVSSAVSNGISNIVGFFTALPGKITSALSGFGSLLVSVGQNLMQGFINGVSGFASRMISAVTSPIKGAIDGAKNLLGIHSPSRVFRQIGDYVGQGLVQGLKGSVKGVQAASRRMADAVGKAFESRDLSEGQAAGAYTAIAAANRALSALADGRERLGERLTSANKRLKDAQKVYDDFRTAAQKSVGSLDVTKSKTGEGIIESLQAQLANVKKFTSVITSLRKKGLDATSYKQFIAAGVSSLPLAQDLLSGGKDSIKKVAGLQGQLSKASGAFATTAADDMYGAGVQAAKGLVQGLQSQQSAIEKQMTGIARAMVRTIRSELGIHSPSRVFASDVGQWIPKGIAAGVDGAAGSYARSLDSMLAYRPSSSLSRASAIPAGTAPAGGFSLPDSITLVDADGSILARTKVIASTTVASSNRARATALQAGSRRR